MHNPDTHLTATLGLAVGPERLVEWVYPGDARMHGLRTDNHIELEKRSECFMGGEIGQAFAQFLVMKIIDVQHVG